MHVDNNGLALIRRKYQAPDFVHLEPRSYNTARKLRAFLEPPTKPLDPAHPSEGFVAMQNDNNKEVMCQVINELCHDKVIFQHCKNLNDPAKIQNVKDILIEFHKRGYLDNQVMSGEGLLFFDANWISVSLVEMKQHSVDVQKQEWFDETAKCANTIWGCQDAHTFVIMLQYFGEQFAFSFFDRGGAVCPDMLNIMDDKEEYLRLVLYLSLANPGMVGLETSIMHNNVGQFVRSKVFRLVPIEMVLFISNNLHGRGTMARHVTLMQCHITEALQSVGTWEVMKKWLKGIEDDVAVVVKDTWVDLTAPLTEGMILNYLRLKGVMGITWLLFEGLVAGPAIPPSLDQLHNHPGIGLLKDIGAITQTGGLNVWCSTIYNWSFLGVSTLALAHKSMTKSVNAYDHQHPINEGSKSKLELVTREVYQERMLTRSWLYPPCTPIYKFSCVYKALVGIVDCIKSHGQAFSSYHISENGSETDELFPISFMQADTSMWNMGLTGEQLIPPNSARTTRFDEAYYMIMPSLPGLHDPPPQKQASHQRFLLLIPRLFLPLLPLFHMLSLFRLTCPLPILPLNVLLFHMLPLFQLTLPLPILNVLLFHFLMQHLLPWSHHSQMFHMLPPHHLIHLCHRVEGGEQVDLNAGDAVVVDAKVHIKPKDVVQSLQVNVAGYGSPTTNEDLEHFADKGRIYELTIVHDLEGYYYVILTLAFMFDGLYALKKVPDADMASGAEMWLHRWLENTIEIEIWQEAVEKQHYLGTDAGFSMVEGLLGEDWAIEPMKTMLKEMREHLFTNAVPTHSGMLDIITNALVKIRTNPDLAHLCKPQKMTMECANATGGNGVPSHSSILPAL
ncbi:uncharacterized protein EDB91DRAFT_1080896 [Suillus paluster]|uniref:uncharacterized protein n=1 Tax=Suillus paluster TaxID=48578 RepID=UPI001B86A304|nr:uncharacterized protein EDB91DRAFT_1080896 [Suillus paluster]KAG1744089.1 hypothetical protein EDB91DRAFT_1080896 [Suillus paluster]